MTNGLSILTKNNKYAVPRLLLKKLSLKSIDNGL